ncbi:hypothetical protein JW960_23180 [candidate division KSB1 bacterium]|nr:hypothetical protein [candidate division KSB1 bacterium]
MKQVMYTAEQVKALIEQGKNLILAGDENVLRKLPTGNWIGGTIPYFMAEEGGRFDQTNIYVTELPDYIKNNFIIVYDEFNLNRVYTDIPENGMGFILIPAACNTHLSFSLNAPGFEKFAFKPLLGWITGVNLADLGKVSPKVFNGESGKVIEDGAVVFHMQLPENKISDMSIVNVFEQGQGDTFTFPEDGFQVTDVYVNGQKQNFADYLLENKIDTKLPLVADYYGASVNVSFQQIDKDARRVDLYAPVFQNVEYRCAQPVEDYVNLFESNMPKDDVDSIFFSCNCILNYLYSELENKQTGGITGPITFGEIAYQLLNQTMVYLTIMDK